MPIFIAKTHDGAVESVVLAKSYDLAKAYWQGRQIFPHSVDSKTEKDLEKHPTGVLPIVTTAVVTASKFGKKPRDFLVISK